VALVRILVDGYSLLHGWPELAPRIPRHSAAARDELILMLTQYRDAVGVPITIFFDGSGAPPGTPKLPSSPELEILYSKAGQTADQMIERTAYRLREYGEVLVVTDDFAERDTVIGFGCMAESSGNFIRSIETALEVVQHELKSHNRREADRFRQARRA
jgi:predicted RNA-binding protein with PIN domain